jgi:hypothetical protein
MQLVIERPRLRAFSGIAHKNVHNPAKQASTQEMRGAPIPSDAPSSSDAPSDRAESRQSRGESGEDNITFIPNIPAIICIH